MENINTNNQLKEISPKHFFLHIFAILMLYFFAINLITLIFQSINLLIPDTLPGNIYSYINKESIRFSLASIIIIFPVFLIASFFLQKSYKENPEVEKMRIRKWLVYLTLFIGIIVIVFDLVAVVFWFLKGEITLRFILKALSLFVIIGLIFTYYGRDIRKGISSTEKKYWTAGIALLFLIVIIIGFSLAGSPQKERLRRFDAQKVSDLNNIEWQIVSYYQKKGYLPENLFELEDDISGFRIPKDSQTGEDYEYQIKSDESFEICANFNLTSEETGETMPFYDQKGKFEHGVGRECFERTIDRELYPKIDSEGIKNPNPTTPVPVIP